MHIEVTAQEFAELLNLTGGKKQPASIAAESMEPKQKAPRPTREATTKRILELLKSEWSQQGFNQGDAIDLVHEQLQLGSTTTRSALAKGIKNAELIKKDRLYFWTSFVESEVRKQIEQKQLASAKLEQPITAPTQ